MEKLTEPEALPSAATSASVTLQRTISSPTKHVAWFRKLGAGIRLDICTRAPWYISDWSDAWNYRVVPATALIFFAKYPPITCTLGI